MEMVIDNIKEEYDGFGNKITAQVTTDLKKCSLWFSWTGDTRPVAGDIFLFAVLKHAMNTGGSLIFCGSVSKKLTELIPKIQKVLMEHDNKLKPVDIVIEKISNRQPPKKHNGQFTPASFFNRDIDTLYTLSKKHREVDHLIVAHGDYFGSYSKMNDHRNHIKYQTSILKKKFTEIKTNANELYHNKTGTVDLDNPLLTAAISLIYSQRFSHLYIPSSHNPGSKTNNRMYQLINTFLKENGTTLIPHGSSINEENKIDTIASSDLYTEALRICWENPTRNFNCGRCTNCIRTHDPIKTVRKWRVKESELVS